MPLGAADCGGEYRETSSGPKKTQYLGGIKNGVRARASSIFAMRSSDCEIVSRLRKVVSCKSHCSCRKWRWLFRIEVRIVSRSLGKCNGWSVIAAYPAHRQPCVSPPVDVCGNAYGRDLFRAFTLATREKDCSEHRQAARATEQVPHQKRRWSGTTVRVDCGKDRPAITPVGVAQNRWPKCAPFHRQ